MDKQKHKIRHIELHKKLDELLADYIEHTGKLLSESTIMDVMKWSHEQTINPSEENK